jgi:hypothetical protein
MMIDFEEKEIGEEKRKLYKLNFQRLEENRGKQGGTHLDPAVKAHCFWIFVPTNTKGPPTFPIWKGRGVLFSRWSKP